MNCSMEPKSYSNLTKLCYAKPFNWLKLVLYLQKTIRVPYIEVAHLCHSKTTNDKGSCSQLYTFVVSDAEILNRNYLAKFKNPLIVT